MNFEEFKAKASGVLDTVANATSRAAGAAKLSVNVYAEEEKIKTAYQAIGKLYFADSKAGAPLSGPAYDQQMAKIEAAMARIEELKNQDSIVPAGSPTEEPVTEEDFAD